MPEREYYTDRQDRSDIDDEHFEADLLASKLAEIRKRAEAVKWSSTIVPHTVDSAADVPRLLAGVDAVLALHSDFRIYDDCDHDHTTEDVEQNLAFDTGSSYSCDEFYLYSICRECCTEPEYGQTEMCASEHNHRPGKALCGTREAIYNALLGKDGTSG